MVQFSSSAALPIDHRSEFAADMRSAGIVLDDLPIDDGQVHRFRVNGDKSGSKNGWYCLYGDGVLET